MTVFLLPGLPPRRAAPRREAVVVLLSFLCTHACGPRDGAVNAGTRVRQRLRPRQVRVPRVVRADEHVLPPPASVLAQMWLRPGADVAPSWRRCGSVPAQMRLTIRFATTHGGASKVPLDPTSAECTAQGCAAQCIAAQCIAAQCIAMRCDAVQRSTAQHGRFLAIISDAFGEVKAEVLPPACQRCRVGRISGCRCGSGLAWPR
jgi:hypothetical protein